MHESLYALNVKLSTFELFMQCIVTSSSDEDLIDVKITSRVTLSSYGVKLVIYIFVLMHTSEYY